MTRITLYTDNMGGAIAATWDYASTLSALEKRERLQNILKDFGVKRVKELQPEQISEYIAKLGRMSISW